MMTPEDVKITGADQRRGMGVGGRDMLWTATHNPTGCAVTWRTTGSYPETQHRMKERALMALELIVEVYDKSEPSGVVSSSAVGEAGE